MGFFEVFELIFTIKFEYEETTEQDQKRSNLMTQPLW